MKLKFKHQPYQADSVQAIVDCFQGQPKVTGFKYAIDPGREAASGFVALPGTEAEGFANASLAISPATILTNLQEVQRRQILPVSPELVVTPVSKLNLDIEMETGTGKTYCYIKTMFELHKQYGWSKFIVVVPSIAIREGVAKSFEVMAEHFLEQYGKKARSFIYNSKQLHNLESYSSDEVAKYRQYSAEAEQAGEYARIFEEEYDLRLNEVLTLEDTPYNRYLKGIQAAKTHNGYFSQDKKSKRLVDPAVKARGENAGEADDVDAYDLILKDKERLLSLDEPVRFIFSHSALREGWDNPNVFVICALKHTDNTVSRRQEVGRGIRLSVNANGDRMDDPAIVHEINVLTVVANESYKDFVTGLQKDISATLSSRPKLANEEYFKDKILKTADGELIVTQQLAKLIERYLVKNDYTDTKDHITEAYGRRSTARPPTPSISKPTS